MSELKLVTDRTQDDVNRASTLEAIKYADMTAAERAEWDAGLKGTYNAEDLNRVESAVEYLAAALRSLPGELRELAAILGVAWDSIFEAPYNPNDYNPIVKTDWLKEDVQTPQDMERYLSNVVLLRNALKFASDAIPARMDNLSWSGANAIEKALSGLDDALTVLGNLKKSLINNAAAAWYFSGEIYTAEV